MIVLKNERLKVEIAEPGSAYRGTRFDWSSFITQVTLDGEHTFCQPESQVAGEGTGGIGLCCEFAYDKTLGYEEARPGELFPKPGVGLLRKPDEAPYLFMRPYEIAEPFPIQVEASADQAVFTVEPIECRGFALRLVRRLELRENRLRVACELENTGSRAVDTHEYCHNFMGIDHHPIGPGYQLSFPYRLELRDLAPFMVGLAPPLLRRLLPRPLLIGLIRALIRRHNRPLEIHERQIGFRSVPDTWFILQLARFEAAPGPQWELVHQPSGAGARESDSFPPARVTVWGAGHVISAEVFVDIKAAPGERFAWTREYEFFD